MRRLGGSKGIVAWVARGICLASLLTTRRVCDGMIEQNIVRYEKSELNQRINTFLRLQDIFLHIVDNNTQLTPYTVCGIMLQVNNCALGSDANNHLEWSVHIDEEFRRSSNGSKSEITKASKDDLVIVHITDIHYDPYYREGANAVCGEPVCCRENQVKCSRFACMSNRKSYFECISVFRRVKPSCQRMAQDAGEITETVIHHGKRF